MHVHRMLRVTPGNRNVLGVVLVTALSLMTTNVWAESTMDAIAFDSELTMVEENEFGAYRHYSITLRIVGGQATLSINKDGQTANLSVPLGECQAMWQRLLDSDLETITDSPIETLPDQSHFTIQYRVIDQQRSFVAHSVDELTDARYRYIVSQILSMGDSHLAQANQGGEQ